VEWNEVKRQMSSSRGAVVAAVTAGAMALGVAAAVADDAKVLLFENSAKIQSGAVPSADDPPEDLMAPVVHVQRLTEIGPSFYGGDPTFSSFVGTQGSFVLKPNADVFATVLTLGSAGPSPSLSLNALYWDGGDDGTADHEGSDSTVPGAAAFGALPPQVKIRVAKFNFLANDIFGENTLVPLFSHSVVNPDDAVFAPLATTNDLGEMHQQIAVSVHGEDQLGGGPPPDGFYLIALQMEMEGLISSDPIHLLLNAMYLRGPSGVIMEDSGMPQFDTAGEAMALDWVQTNLVPEPGSLVVMVAIGAWGFHRRAARPIRLARAGARSRRPSPRGRWAGRNSGWPPRSRRSRGGR